MIKKIYCILLLLLSIISILLCSKSTIVPTKVIIPLVIIYVLLLTLSFLLIFCNKKVLTFMGIFVSCIVIIISGILCYTNYRVDILLNKVTSTEYENFNYSVIVLKNSNYNKIEDLNNKKFGLFKSEVDNYYSDAQKKLQNIIEIVPNNYNSIADLLNDFYKGKIDSLFLNQSYISVVNEIDNKFNDSIKIIYTINIKEKQNNITKKTDLSSMKSFNVLISGIDTYGGIGSVSRSDVNILATVNPKTGKILLVHIPRDYYLQLHGTTGLKDKLTHSGVYGINTTINTISDLFDTDINYYIRINFNSLISLIDKIGGIDIYSDTDFNAWTNYKVHINKGWNHLDGASALAYSRERHAYMAGDRHRGENQEDVISAVINKITNSKDISTYTTLFNEMSNLFQTNMSKSDINNFINTQVDNSINWSVNSYNVNGSDAMEYTYSYPSQKLYVMVPDINTVNNAKSKIKEYMG